MPADGSADPGSVQGGKVFTKPKYHNTDGSFKQGLDEATIEKQWVEHLRPRAKTWREGVAVGTTSPRTWRPSTIQRAWPACRTSVRRQSTEAKYRRKPAGNPGKGKHDEACMRLCITKTGSQSLLDISRESLVTIDDVRYTNRNWLTLFLPSRRQVVKAECCSAHQPVSP